MACTKSARGLTLVVMTLMFLLSACGDGVSAEEHFQKGNEFTEAQEYDKAIVEFEAALNEDPEHISAMVNLGVVYYQVGRLDEAIEQYQKAIELKPEDADSHSNLAAAYVQKDQLQKALEEYQRAVDLDPELAEPNFGLGVVYFKLGRAEEAVQAFERFQELDTGKDQTATDQAEQYLQLLRGQ